MSDRDQQELKKVSSIMSSKESKKGFFHSHENNVDSQFLVKQLPSRVSPAGVGVIGFAWLLLATLPGLTH